MVVSIAKETGWDEEYILDMPMAKIWGFRHAILRSYDAATYHVTSQKEKDELFEMFNGL